MCIKLRGQRVAHPTLARASNLANKKLANLIQSGTLSKDEILTLQQQSGDNSFFGFGQRGKGSLIRDFGIDNVVSRAEVEEQARLPNFISSLATNLSPANELGLLGFQMGFSNEPTGKIAKLPIPKARNPKSDASDIDVKKPSTQAVPQGKPYLIESAKPIDGTTVQLSGDLQTQIGKLPKGTVITVSGNTFKAILPDGSVLKGQSSKLAEQRTLMPPMYGEVARDNMNGGKLIGTPTTIKPKANEEERRSLQRENESAVILANKGFIVEQNPNIPNTLKNPDYKINNEVFDNYAPKADTARKITGNMKVKVDSGQTNNIVVNLSDSPIKTNELVQQLFNYPIPNLKKVIIDKQGNYKLLKF